jgi:hypothetical protein
MENKVKEGRREERRFLKSPEPVYKKGHKIKG